jgi:hypothetical protein
MPLRQTLPSEAVKRALREGIADFMDSNDPLAKTLLTASFGLRVFTLGLDKLDESFKQSLQSAGWRFMALSSSGLPIAADVVDRGDGEPPRMISLSRDPVIADMVVAARRIEKSPEVQAKDYDLRLLRIPGVLTEAFWLKPLVGEDHLIVPILTKSRGLLQEKRPLPIADFLSIVRGLANEFRERSNRPPEERPASSL